MNRADIIATCATIAVAGGLAAITVSAVDHERRRQAECAAADHKAVSMDQLGEALIMAVAGGQMREAAAIWHRGQDTFGDRALASAWDQYAGEGVERSEVG